MRSVEASKKWPKKREFVALMAALMASNALAIDAMLPALPAIGAALGVEEDNRRQFVISSYLLGFGAAQLAFGPLADRFGRKRLLAGSLLLYALFAALAGLASSFALLLGARALQGAAAAGTRVLVVAIIRDRFQGAGMAQIMSLVMLVFMIVPVLAPAFGQAVLAVGTWRHIFIGLAVYGAVLIAWLAWRLPESLAEENRRPFTVASLSEAGRMALSSRVFTGNTLAVTLVMAALFAFINSVQQIVGDVFGRPELLALVFALIAGPMAASSWANARLVMHFGARRLLLQSLAAFTALSLLHLAYAAAAGETLWSFVILQAATMACFGLVGANAGALAMEPLGRVAGTASSIQGTITTIGGALIGAAIGLAFDGTVLPMLTGFVLCGGAALAAAAWANRSEGEGRAEGDRP